MTLKSYRVMSPSQEHLRRDLESTFVRNVNSHGSDTRSNLTTTEVVSTRSDEPRGAGVQRALSFASVRTPKRFGLLRATAAAAAHARPLSNSPSLCSAMDGCRDIVRAHSERLFLPRPRATPSFLPRTAAKRRAPPQGPPFE